MLTAGVNWIAHAAMRSSAASSAAVSRGTTCRSAASAEAAADGHAGLYAAAARGLVAGDDLGEAAADRERRRRSVPRAITHGARVNLQRQ